MENAIQSGSDTPTTPPLKQTASPEADLTGQVLGEFRLLHRLGRGGMGEVYLAEQTTLKRKVALKLLHPDLASNERSLKRFEAEALNVARATHANIVQIITLGKTNGINYIALEYVEGKNLREFLDKKGTPELSVGLHIMAQVAAALQRAAEFGIIHRDIKPENILLTKKGEVKVADFGLSRDESKPQNLTQSQVVMGTPLYMSPEQVERGIVDSRTDIYSFGATCYHMFTGNPPFRGNSPVDVAYQHVHHEPQPLGAVRPDLPADLCWIIHKMMAKRQEDRYQTAGEVLRDISRLRESLNLGTMGAISISATFLGTAPDSLSGSATQPWLGEPRSFPWGLAILLAGSVLVALAGSVFVGGYWQQRGAAPKDLPHVEEPAPIKALFSLKEREQELRKLVQKYAQPETAMEASTGLTHSIELARFYLEEKKYDELEKFFKELRDADRKMPAYRLLGRIGHPIVLAFKDKAKESNDEFLVILPEIERIGQMAAGNFKAEPGVPKRDQARLKELKENIEPYKQLWKETWKVREMVALALNYNFANSPQTFPADKLTAYRFPPKPTLRP